MLKTACIGFAAAWLLPAPLLAADLPLKPAPQPRPEQSAPAQQPDEFDKLGGDCMEASDGCRRFVRAADGKFDATNNIGIACQPAPLTCTRRR